MTAVVQELNALVPAIRGAAYNCGSDDGAEVRLVIAYRDRHQERVDADLSGCRFASHPHQQQARITTQVVRRDIAARSGYRGAVS